MGGGAGLGLEYVKFIYYESKCKRKKKIFFGGGGGGGRGGGGGVGGLEEVNFSYKESK